ncbi:MAG: LysO family transporter [Barnesiella sp.]
MYRLCVTLTKKNSTRHRRITLYIIFLLLFFMGISIGNNKEIIHNLGGLGLQAIIIAVASTTGSVLLAWLLFRTLFNKHNRP